MNRNGVKVCGKHTLNNKHKFLHMDHLRVYLRVLVLIADFKVQNTVLASGYLMSGTSKNNVHVLCGSFVSTDIKNIFSAMLVIEDKHVIQTKLVTFRAVYITRIN